MNSLAQPSPASTGPHLDNRRVAAALIDLVVPAAIGAVAYAAGLSFTFGVILVAIGWTLYYFFALESGGGQTLGKRVMKLRVVSADGTPASMEQIAKRTMVRILDGHIVGLIVMLATGDKRQRLGDIVAGTMVTDAEAAQPEVAEATTVETDPYSVGAYEDAEPPAAASTSGRRSLRLPKVRKPSLPRPSFSKPSFSKPSFAKPSFSKPSLTMPQLRRRASRRDDEPSPAAEPSRDEAGRRIPWYKRQLSLPSLGRRKETFVDPMFLESVRAEPEALDETPPPAASRRPQPRRPRPGPEPVDAGPESGDGPEPIEDFMRREVLIEREDEVTPDERESEPFDPSLGLDDHEPSVEFERPHPADYDTAVESVMEYEAQVERDVEHDAAPDPADDAHEDPAEDSDDPAVKPIETVSAIDLVMQDAEERRPEDR